VKINLHKKQSIAFSSSATEILYGGAAGGGKSHLMRVQAMSLAIEVSGIQIYLFRRLSDDLYKNHMEGAGGFFFLLSELMQSGHAKYNGSKNYISFWNGAKIWLCHCQYEKDVMKYQGPDFHVLMIDELTHFTRKIYTFLRSRLRLGGLDIPDKYKGKLPFALAGTNPGGVGHNWVKNTFVDYANPLEINKVDRNDGGMLRQYIPAKIADNPSLDADYEDKLSGIGEEWLVKAMRDGDWNIVAGGMFDDVWKDSVHIKTPFKIPSCWTIDRCFDWGSTKPFAVNWFAESDGTDYEDSRGNIYATQRGDIFIIGELYGCTGKPNEGVKWTDKKISEEILAYESNNLSDYKIEPGVADTSIFTEINENSTAKIMEENGVEWRKANKSPGSRINGWQLMRNRLKNAIDGEGEGLYVFNNCRHTIRTLPTLPRDQKKLDDVDTNAEDHIADEIRYRILDYAPKMATGIDVSFY
jgi:hypothetical protein